MPDEELSELMSTFNGGMEAGRQIKRRKMPCEQPKKELSIPLDEHFCSIVQDVLLITRVVIVIATFCVMALEMRKMAFEGASTVIGKSRMEPAYTGELRILLPY